MLLELRRLTVPPGQRVLLEEVIPNPARVVIVETLHATSLQDFAAGSKLV